MAGSAAATARFCGPATAARAGIAQPLNIAEHLFASHWLDESHGWLAGSRGMTIQTSDGGRSWSKNVVPGDFTFNAVTFANASRGWLAGEFGVIFQSSDGGKSWVKQKSPVEVSFDSGASQNLFALLFTAPGNGYAFGLDGLVLKYHGRIALGDHSPAGKLRWHKRDPPSVRRSRIQRTHLGGRRKRHAAPIGCRQRDTGAKPNCRSHVLA